MPKKRDGQTQKSIQFPDDLLAGADAKRGEKPLNAYVCELVSADTGVAYEHKLPGRPKTVPKPKPKERGRKQKGQ